MSRPEALNVVAALSEAKACCRRLSALAWTHAVDQHHPNGSPKKQGATLNQIRWRPTKGQKQEARYAAALLLRVANDDGQDFRSPVKVEPGTAGCNVWGCTRPGVTGSRVSGLIHCDLHDGR